MFNKEKFQSDLFEFRTKNRLSRAAVEAKSKVKKETIAGLENNLYSPTIDNFFKLCDCMQVEPSNYKKS